MSCCAPGVEAAAGTAAVASPEEIRLASRDLGGGLRQTDLSVPAMHCAACIQTVERTLGRLPGVENARVNLSTRRASVKWRGEAAPPMIAALEKAGYQAHLFEAEEDKADPELSRLIRALGVAGFCSMNIMLLSVSVWSGADAETRQAFHWISAALALPCLLYSGRVFFASAFAALKGGRTNMDVPISIGISLAFGLSLYDTLHHGEHAYFDAATTLVFFLLIGRTLDHVMREKARAAVRGLVRLSPRGAMVERPDGSRDYLPMAEIEPGMRVLLAAGERVPVDGTVTEGVSDLDCAIATGESDPRRVEPGATVRAGTLNLTGPLTVVASARAQESFLAEMVRLMEAAEGGRARYRRLADRAAQLYSPVVHATALLTFIGWMLATGDWHRAIGIAIAVLIITCPCALGLAVPIVQVIAARRLFENGIMVKDGSGIERLAGVDAVAFDKTGTLTLGRPRLLGGDRYAPDTLSLAAALAVHSRHPLSQALAAAGAGLAPASSRFTDIVEHPGLGIEARQGETLYRLGRAGWALSGKGEAAQGTVLSRDGRLLATFAFEDTVRPGGREAVRKLQDAGLAVEILSGDREPVVADVAARFGIGASAGALLPADKVGRLQVLAREGRRVLMVGDGLNDAPALASAYVSMAPATAADIGRNAADFVFLHESLDAVPTAYAVARDAGRLVKQNFGLAIGYNAIALPIAIAGFVTPLVAAVAMSLSSVIVVANALRLRAGKPAKAARGSQAGRAVGGTNPLVAAR
ncbi:cation-translocating P-type ATPase [Aquamicrobium soli]|jgi:Cu2+-exporting ATPase|uniref:Cation-translocating P-type ATPase n=1 Tax=Aquamicrobium soli TaxID=1811518 RepID=A0ABV7KFB3_9HYPH